MSIIQELCRVLGVPLSPEKIVGPAQRIVYLGIEIDTVKQSIQLPKDKLEKVVARVAAFQSRQSVTKQELLSLVGLLSFASKVVRPGRMFLRRLIDLSTTVNSLHHHIKLTAAARSDLGWWHQFLHQWNGVGYIPRPPISSPNLELMLPTVDWGAFTKFFG